MAISPQEVAVLAWRRAHAHIPFIGDLEKAIDRKVEVHPNLEAAEMTVSICWPWYQDALEAISTLYRLRGWKKMRVEPSGVQHFYEVTLAH